MRPLKLSKKSNPLGEIMNLQDAFAKLKEVEHDSSFKNLGEWLNNNNSKPGKMKSIYKIAASFILAGLIFIACSMPVQQEEEIGYMIVGIIESDETDIKLKLNEASIDTNQIIINEIIYEIEEEEQAHESDSEIVLVLPDAPLETAIEKRELLESVFNFKSISMITMEEEVERPLYEVALKTFDIELRNDLPDSVIAKRIDKFLHENSSSTGTTNITYNEEGMRVVEIVTELEGTNLVIKQSVERLYNDLTTPKIRISKLDSLSMDTELKEIQKIKEKRDGTQK